MFLIVLNERIYEVGENKSKSNDLQIHTTDKIHATAQTVLGQNYEIPWLFLDFLGI